MTPTSLPVTMVNVSPPPGIVTMMMIVVMAQMKRKSGTVVGYFSCQDQVYNVLHVGLSLSIVPVTLAILF